MSRLHRAATLLALAVAVTACGASAAPAAPQPGAPATVAPIQATPAVQQTQMPATSPGYQDDYGY